MRVVGGGDDGGGGEQPDDDGGLGEEYQVHARGFLWR